MNQRLIAPRALAAFMARRAIKIATIIALVIALASIAVSAILVYFFTPWWWLLAVPFLLLFGVFLLLRIIAIVTIRFIHPNNLTREQTKAMNEFIDKIQVILEARATPPIFIWLICIKDILLHRDVVTIKKLIADTASLRNDYANIEKLFS